HRLGRERRFYFFFSSVTTRTRCATLATIPRDAGVSTIVRRRPILFRPSPLRVSVCLAGRRAALRNCSIVKVLLISRHPVVTNRLVTGSGDRAIWRGLARS